MLIDCPACARSYHLGRGEIGDHGRTVICPRCQTRWFVDGEGRPLDDLATSGRVHPRPPLRDPVPSLGGGLRPLVVVIACMAGVMGLIGLRVHVVRAMPRMARLYALAGLPVNTRGVTFEHVASLRLDPATVGVSGELRNVAARRVNLARLAYEIRDSAGVTLISWTERPPTRTLGAGETIAFTAAPHDAPRNGDTVSVHFVP